MTEGDRDDLAGVLAIVRDAQQRLALGVLATMRSEPRVAENFLRQAQQRATAAEIDLCRLIGSATGDSVERA